MSFFARAGIALLAGVGAGTIGFGTAYLIVERILLANPGVGHDGWLLFAIFGPGMGAAMGVFHYLSGHAEDAEEWVAE